MNKLSIEPKNPKYLQRINKEISPLFDHDIKPSKALRTKILKKELLESKSIEIIKHATEDFRDQQVKPVFTTFRFISDDEETCNHDRPKSICDNKLLAK